MSAWLKAGIIGGVVVAVLNVVGLIPLAGCLIVVPALVTYGCVGALAAYWMPPVRMAGPAAGQGALAGLIAAAIGTGVGLILNVSKAAVLGPGQDLAPIPPETLQELQRQGIDPGMFLGTAGGVAGAAGGGVICCGVSMVIAAGLGALGGIIFAAVKSE